MSDLEIVGVQEVALLAKVSKAAVSNWRTRFTDFPKPIAELAAGPVFRRDQVVVWLKRRRIPMATVISMINLKGRLQRLNRAVTAPGEAHDDWEILRDLIHAVSGSNGIAMIEDVFKAMAGEVKEFAGLSLSKIGDLGVQIIEEKVPTSA